MARHYFPAEIWIGTEATLHDAAIRLVQEMTSPCKGCTVCMHCYAIAQKQWPQLLWVTPGANGHTRETITDTITQMELSIDSPHAIIIEQAEALTPASGQALLKPLEEPLPGWHIILLTRCASSLLPTIRSRCIERVFGSDSSSSQQQWHQHATIAWLCNPTKAGYTAACRALPTLPTNVQATTTLCESILLSWYEQRADSSRSAIAHRMLTMVSEASAHPPGSGGTIFFWRTLLCKTYTILSSAEPQR